MTHEHLQKLSAAYNSVRNFTIFHVGISWALWHLMEYSAFHPRTEWSSREEDSLHEREGTMQATLKHNCLAMAGVKQSWQLLPQNIQYNGSKIEESQAHSIWL